MVANKKTTCIADQVLSSIMNHLFSYVQKVGHSDCGRQHVLLCCETTLFLSLLWYVCVSLSTFLAHRVLFLFALMLFSHRDWTFSMVVAQIYHISQLPSPSRFHLDHSWDYISHGSLEEPRTVPISFVPGLKRQAKPGCARHISAAATQARRLGGWHDVSESRLPSTVPVVSFCHLQEESQMLWHDKAARLARQSGCMGGTKGDGLPPFWLQVWQAIIKFLRRDGSSVELLIWVAPEVKTYGHEYMFCVVHTRRWRQQTSLNLIYFFFSCVLWSYADYSEEK